MQAAATSSALALSPAPPISLSASASARPRHTAARAGSVRCDLAAPSAPASSPAIARWAQRTIVIPPQRRGCHLITHKIMHEIRSDLSEFKCGLAHLFCKNMLSVIRGRAEPNIPDGGVYQLNFTASEAKMHHTSASLTINENYDPDVQTDTETFLNRIVPEGTSAPWRHTIEGPDDMPAHIKSSMFGCALTIPITNGRFNMGTWQGIWLCEHRDYPTPRTIVITLNGM